MPDVRLERTGWRDLSLNERHRLWGWDCPAVDIDNLFLEYDQGQPKALIEYKNEHAEAVNPEHPSYRALRALANGSKIPLLLVRYASDFSWWAITPMNDHARAVVSQRTTITEQAFVVLQYKLRGYTVTEAETTEMLLTEIRKQRASAAIHNGKVDQYPFRY
jgi:hypothetical protein